MILEFVTDYEKKIFFSKNFSELRFFKKFSNRVFKKWQRAIALFNSLNESLKNLLSTTEKKTWGAGIRKGSYFTLKLFDILKNRKTRGISRIP